MRHHVAAVIQNRIRGAKFATHFRQERGIGLVADADIDLILGKPPAFRIDIQADYSRMRAEEPLPHLQRAAFAAADFDKQDIAVYEFAEVALIGREVMLPLMDYSPVVGQEIGV